MPLYETVFIARQDLTEKQVKEMTETFSKIITDMGGKIAKTEQWGLRNFAYKINKAKRGHYTLLELDTPSEALIEMERQMRLNEDVVRTLTIKLEELSDGPSVMMKKSYDNDDSDKKSFDKNDKKEAA